MQIQYNTCISKDPESRNSYKDSREDLASVQPVLQSINYANIVGKYSSREKAKSRMQPQRKLDKE